MSSAVSPLPALPVALCTSSALPCFADGEMNFCIYILTQLPDWSLSAVQTPALEEYSPGLCGELPPTPSHVSGEHAKKKKINPGSLPGTGRRLHARTGGMPGWLRGIGAARTEASRPAGLA